MPLLSTCTVPPEAAPTPAHSALCTFPRIQVPRLEDTLPINHLYSNGKRKSARTQQPCLLGRFRLLPPASHSRLNCRALYYSHIIHASLIKAVNSLIVKLENVQHLLLGNSVPGFGFGECQVYGGACQRVHGLAFGYSVRLLSLILRGRVMEKRSPGTGIEAQNWGGGRKARS